MQEKTISGAELDEQERNERARTARLPTLTETKTLESNWGIDTRRPLSQDTAGCYGGDFYADQWSSLKTVS